MLRELFVIDDGISIFHYVNDQVKVTMDPVLVSGFFSAIRAFSEETRDGSLNRYITNKEMALFEKVPKTEKFAVAIYDTKVNEEVGQLILLEIVKLISKSKLSKTKYENVTDTEYGRKLWNQIEEISQLSTTGKTLNKVVESYAEEYPNIDIIQTVDSKTGRTVAKYYRDTNKVNRKFLSSLKSFISAIDDLFSTRQLGENYELILLTDDINNVACIKQKDRINLVSDNNGTTFDVCDVLLRLSGSMGYDLYTDEFLDLQMSTRWNYHLTKGITTVRGETPYIKENHINQVITIGFELMDVIGKQPFQTITVYVGGRQKKKVVISNLYQNSEFEMSIFE